MQFRLHEPVIQSVSRCRYITLLLVTLVSGAPSRVSSPVVDAVELLEQYVRGKRNFRDCDLTGAHLEGAVLDGAMLDWSNLQDAHLDGASLQQTNFEGSNLKDATLEGSNLEGAILNRARLEGANLNGAILVDSKIEKAYLAGANLKRANLRKANLRRAVLRRACLEEAILDEADLEEAILVESCLNRASLDHAYLDRARLRGAHLMQAHLHEAILLGADLRGAKISEASLERAVLLDANFTGAQLDGANLSQAILGRTLLVDINLAPFCGIELSHFGASTVDYASIVKSIDCHKLKQFLRDTGMPQLFVNALLGRTRSLNPGERVSSLLAMFISYAGPDEAFARVLHRSLRNDGVTSFFFSFDTKFGELNANVMHRRIREHDRVIIVCSESSLSRPDIRNELNKVRDQEAKGGESSCLIPIAIDGYVFSEEFKSCDPDFADFISPRVVADFRNVYENDSNFRSAIVALEEALKRSSVSWPPPRQIRATPQKRHVTG